MSLISNFEQIREDGRILQEGMTLQDLQRLGWNIEKIRKLQWLSDGRRVFVGAEYGFLGKVTPSRQYVMAMDFMDPTGHRSQLKSFKADGSLACSIPNDPLVQGEKREGEYQWFEPARVNAPDAIGVVFRFTKDGASYQSDYQLDIDAASGDILGVYEAR